MNSTKKRAEAGAERRLERETEIKKTNNSEYPKLN